MLVLTRKWGQEIVIDGGISIKVLSIRHGRIELGVVAPRHIVVNRAEVEMRLADSNPINPQAKEENHNAMSLHCDKHVA